MKVEIVFGLLMVLIVIISGCSSSTDFSTSSEQKCQAVCLNEELSLNYVSGSGSITYCHCIRIISIPNT